MKKKLGSIDKLIFGAGGQRGYLTFTADKKSPKVAGLQGVDLDVIIHPPNPYSGH